MAARAIDCQGVLRPAFVGGNADPALGQTRPLYDALENPVGVGFLARPML